MRLSRPREMLVIAGLALLPAAGTAWHLRQVLASQDALRPFEVTMATVRDWGDSVLWIDARSPEEFDEGHVPGALPLDEGNWEMRLPTVLEAWQPESRVVVYCTGTRCEASSRVAERLRSDLGTAQVYFLRGGFAAWQTGR